MTTLDYTLTKLQTQVFTSKADIVEWSGDFGVGKTFLAKMKLIAYLLENAGSVGVYMCPSYQSLRHQMLLVPDSFKKLTAEFAETSHTHYHVEFHNGSILYFLPMDKVSEANLCRPNVIVIDGLNSDSEIDEPPRTCDFNKVKSFMLINRSGGENKIVETSKVIDPVNPYMETKEVNELVARIKAESQIAGIIEDLANKVGRHVLIADNSTKYVVEGTSEVKSVYKVSLVIQ